MATVSEHYARHLAPVYVWMAGGVDEALARGAAEIDQLCPDAAPGSAAIDLGAGFGMHAIPLARRGFRVTAIDTSELLLDILKRSAGDLPVATVHDDLLNFDRVVGDKVDLILCMGDTLTHLADLSSVERLFDRAGRMLRTDGRLVLTFRDYSRELSAGQRFIPVRSDDTRILTCFLEYSEQHVTVHDLLYEKRGAAWEFSVSAYPKLRLSPGVVSDALQSRGFEVRTEAGVSGMVRVIATPG